LFGQITVMFVAIMLSRAAILRTQDGYGKQPSKATFKVTTLPKEICC
jgi:hypothetical protein